MLPTTARSNGKTKKERLAQEIAKAVGVGRPVAVETVDFNDPNRPKTCLEVDFPILPINQISQIEAKRREADLPDVKVVGETPVQRLPGDAVGRGDESTRRSGAGSQAGLGRLLCEPSEEGRAEESQGRRYLHGWRDHGRRGQPSWHADVRLRSESGRVVHRKERDRQGECRGGEIASRENRSRGQAADHALLRLRLPTRTPWPVGADVHPRSDGARIQCLDVESGGARRI